MADAAITDQMAVPRAILPESGFEVMHLEKDGVTWTSKRGSPPSILVGFASIDPTEKVKLKQIIQFRVTGRGVKVFNNVEPADDDPVKWTRVSRCRIKEWDDVIISKAGEADGDGDQEAYIVDWLESHYDMYKGRAAEQLGKQHEEKEVKRALEAGKRPRQPIPSTKKSWKARARRSTTFAGTTKATDLTKASKAASKTRLKAVAKAFSRHTGDMSGDTEDEPDVIHSKAPINNSLFRGPTSP